MDIKSLILFSFSSILMDVLWSQTEVNALAMPDCYSLGKVIAGLKKSGENRQEKFDQKWDDFFSDARKSVKSEAHSLDKKCPIIYQNPEKYKYDEIVRANSFRNLSEVSRVTGIMTRKGRSTFHTYIRSSKFEDQIKLAKFVEDECELEVFKLYKALMLATTWWLCEVRKFIPAVVYSWPSPDVSYYNINFIGESGILHRILTANQQLYSQINDDLFSGKRRTEIERKYRHCHLKGQNCKVFSRSVQRMKRLEEKLKKIFVPLNIEAVFNKKQAVYQQDDIKRILDEAEKKYIEHFRSADVQAYLDRLRILAYQMFFVE